MSWTSADPAPSAPPLVVRPDRRRARRWLTVILGLNGMIAVVCLAAALWASSTSMGAWGGVSRSASRSPAACSRWSFDAFFYGRLLGTETIAEVGPAGIRGPTKRWVQVTLPWSSITSVVNGWNVVVITPRPRRRDEARHPLPRHHHRRRHHPRRHRSLQRGAPLTHISEHHMQVRRNAP